MAGRAMPMLLSAVAGIALGSLATTLLTAPPDHRGEMPAAALNPPPAPPIMRDAVAAPPPATPSVTPPAALAAPSDEAQILAARQALSSRLRSPDALRLVDVRIHAFGPADERAVCGTMQTTEVTGGSARFVVRVLQPQGAGSRPPQTVVEDAPWLVRPSPEAARRFCRDPMPEPAPLAVQAISAPAVQPVSTAGASAPLPMPAAEGPRGRVVTQSAANLRVGPQGEVLMAVPRGRSLLVFDRAPGGWMQVGETAPQGWIHSSLLADASAQ